jgi:pantetheine-phosphate adenylyltransferase
MSKLAIYPGTFDPITLGHMDLVERTAEIFDEVIVAVAVDTPKTTLFTVNERVEMAKRLVKPYANVRAESFEGLLVMYARRRGATVMIRGLRAYSDFEYEFQLALANRKLAPETETLFMMPKEVHSYVTSSMVRDIARLGGDPSQFVPSLVADALATKFASVRKPE